MLQVTLLGNLGSDPEARYTATGSKMVTFNVAVNQVRKGPDGERQENTEWFRVRVTGPRTEYVQRFSKGNRVLVMGRLTISHYTGRDGDARTGFDVWADEIESMSLRPRETESMGGEGDAAEPAFAGAGVSSIASAETSSGNGRGKKAGQNASAASGDLEDLPF